MAAPVCDVRFTPQRQTFLDTFSMSAKGRPNDRKVEAIDGAKIFIAKTPLVPRALAKRGCKV
jgi:hypothetical protein